ncbi:MAG: GNAT family N-acetyltransferase [Chloroflexota bacterium]|jgi:GNAT superfamily N-acetyltransferase
MPADVRIRRIRPDEGPVLRDLRLRSIADAPGAFGQPLEEARRRPEQEWQRNARRSSRGDRRTWLLAETDGGSLGLVQGRKRRPRTLLLFSMWVDPSVRRLGVGRLLIGELETWARGWRGQETMLWVMAVNRPAIEFYRELGFSVVRAGRDAEAGARLGALAMRREIHSPTPAHRWLGRPGRGR